MMAIPACVTLAAVLAVLAPHCVAAYDLSSSANCFTLNLYKKLASGKDNVICSPFSADIVMSMLLAGAGNVTADELRSALGFGNTPFSDIADAFKTTLGELGSGNGNNTLNIANSAWLRKNVTIKETFKQTVRDSFKAEVKSEDFATMAHKATEDINDWVNEKTKGLIKKLYDEDLNPSTIMILVNAIYFKGTWARKFEKSKSRNETFFGDNKVNAKVTFMNQKGKFSYKKDQDLNAEILEMNYVGNDISMQIILPPKNTDMATFQNALDCAKFRDVLTSGSETTVDVTMPKFEISSDFDLTPALKSMGIKQVFNRSADLFGICDDKVFVDQVKQKAVIKVYEEGSEAAVVTGAGVRTALARPADEVVVFMADRPFMFSIRGKKENVVLFMGTVKNLS